MSHSLSAQTESSNELNLSRYMKVLWRYWWLIAAGGIVGALLGAAYSVLQPASYQSVAAFAIIRSGLALNLDARLQMVSDGVDPIARRRSLLTIAQSQELALAVIQALGSPPPKELGTPQRIFSRVKVSLDSDVINIQATMPTAEQATKLADTFTRVYEQRANLLLGEATLPSDELNTQTAQARQTYREKQDALAAYLATSPIEELKRRADTLSRELDTQVRLQAKLAHLEEDALALQARLKDGGGTRLAGAQLAQLLLEANAFNTEPDATGVLPSFDLTGAGGETLTAAEQAQTLDGLIQAMRARRQAQTPQGQEAVYAELNKTQAELEQAQAKLKELQAGRDLAWNTYQLLNTKVSESNIASGYQNQTVRLISPASVASSPTSRLPLNTLIGAALGIIAGAGLAFLFEWLPFGKKRAAPADAVTLADNAAR